MLIKNEFVVVAPTDHLWAYLLDVEKIAPCMPGAELTEVVDAKNWKGRMKMKFGPVAMAFAGTVTMMERDDDAHRVVLKAQGQESKGKGAATATVTSWLEPSSDDRTTVKMQADIALSGFVAQVSRGMLPDISARLTQQFADCLQESMAAEETDVGPGASAGATGSGSSGTTDTGKATPAPKASAPEAVGGLRLGLWALLRSIGRLFGRLFGKRYD